MRENSALRSPVENLIRPLSRPPGESGMSDFSHPSLREDAVPKNVIDLQQKIRQNQEGKHDEFGGVIGRDDIRDRELAEERGEKVRLRGSDVDVNEIMKSNQMESERIRAMAKDRGFEKIANLDALLSALNDLQGEIADNEVLTENAKKQFKLDNEYEYTLGDVVNMVETAQAGIAQKAFSKDEIELLPYRFPETFGLKHAMERIVQNLL